MKFVIVQVFQPPIIPPQCPNVFPDISRSSTRIQIEHKTVTVNVLPVFCTTQGDQAAG